MAKDTSPSLESFIDKLVEEKGITEADPEIMAQIKDDLLSRAEDRINAAILERMPPSALDEFEKLVGEAPADEVRSFCEAKIPGLDEVVAEALMQFRATYLNA